MVAPIDHPLFPEPPNEVEAPPPPPSQPYLEKEPSYDARQAAHAAATAETERRIKNALLNPRTYIPGGHLTPEMVAGAVKTIVAPITWPADVAGSYANSKLHAAEDAAAPPPPTDLEAKRAAEQATGVMAPSSPAATPEVEAPAPKAAPSGGGGMGGYATPAGPSPLERDFNERIAAMGDEEAARGQMARDVAGAYGGVEEQGRQNAEEQEKQAHEAAMQQRAKIAEVDQLNRDYMNRTIDPDRF